MAYPQSLDQYLRQRYWIYLYQVGRTGSYVDEQHICYYKHYRQIGNILIYLVHTHDVCFARYDFSTSNILVAVLKTVTIKYLDGTNDQLLTIDISLPDKKNYQVHLHNLFYIPRYRVHEIQRTRYCDLGLGELM